MIWPEHVENHALLAGAVEMAHSHPPDVRRADAVLALPDALRELPGDAVPVVYATIALYQIDRPGRAALRGHLARFAGERPMYVVLLEDTGTGCHLVLARLSRYSARARLLAVTSPHGRWLAWQPAAGDSAPSPWLTWLAG